MGYHLMLSCSLQGLYQSVHCSTRAGHVRRINYCRVHDCHLDVLYEKRANPENWLLVCVGISFILSQVFHEGLYTGSLDEWDR
jgi:hypothetical protein